MLVAANNGGAQARGGRELSGSDLYNGVSHSISNVRPDDAAALCALDQAFLG